jgi:uncharacterized protein YxjI
MEKFEVVHKLISVGAQYSVHDGTTENVVATVRGKVLSLTPKLTMVAGQDGAPVAELSGNLTKTKFVVAGPDKKEIGALTFPMFQFKKSFTLTVGKTEYKAEGDVMATEFRCNDSAGNPVMVINKQATLRDRFAVSVGGDLPREVALLAAVAIDQRFFSDQV